MADDISSKRCAKCRLVKPLDDFYRYARNSDGRQSYCKSCDGTNDGPRGAARRETGRRYREAHRDKTRAAVLASIDRVRRAVFDHYGWACTCCASAENLTIDHVDGNGHAHRLALFGNAHTAGATFYRWLIRQGLPNGYQTMCKPCNRSKANGLSCRLKHALT